MWSNGDKGGGITDQLLVLKAFKVMNQKERKEIVSWEYKALGACFLLGFCCFVFVPQLWISEVIPGGA